MSSQQHNFHLVDNSPWPFMLSCQLFFITFGTASAMHFFLGGSFLLQNGLIYTVLILSFGGEMLYEKDLYRTSFYKVQKNLRLECFIYCV